MAKETILYEELLDILRSMETEGELFKFFLRACENENLKVCQICLDAGADANMKEDDVDGKTIFSKLVESGKFTSKVGDWLIKKGADITCSGCFQSNICIACRVGSFDAAKYLIDKGLPICYGNYGYNDLYHAVFGGNYRIVKMLLDLEDVNLKFDKTAAFLEATQKTTPKMVELFLQNDVSPNFYNRVTIPELREYAAYTPLHIAVRLGTIEIAKILLKYNANVNAKLEERAIFLYDNCVLTPMDIAIRDRNQGMRKLLDEFGGKASTREEKLQALSGYKYKNEDRELVFAAMKKILES